MMRRLVLVLLLLSASVGAQERFTLQTPLSTSIYAINELRLTWGDGTVAAARITISLSDATTGANPTVAVYNGAIAQSLMIALNKANLTTRSLNQRVLDRLILDGKIAGTVTGSVP